MTTRGQKCLAMRPEKGRFRALPGRERRRRPLSALREAPRTQNRA